jgi:hypothetical protein
MSLVCELRIEAYCRPTEVIRPLTIHACERMLPYLTIYAQLGPIYIAFSAR